MTKQSKKSEKNYSPTVIHLTRKQVLQMAEMVNHFSEVKNFEIQVSHGSGIGPSVIFCFTLDLAGEKTPVNVDTTDVTTW
jgi:hypothetical protein